MRVAVAIVPEVRQLLREDPSQLAGLLEEIHDEDLADLLELLEEDERIRVLEQLGVDDAADVFERLEEHEQAELVEQFGPERLAPIVSEMAPDDRTDLVEALPDSIGDALLDAMDPDAAAEVEELIAWADDTAGGLMTTDLIRLSPDLTVNAVIGRLRDTAEDAETIYYIYGVEDDGTLSGVASLRDLIIADGDTQLLRCLHRLINIATLEQDAEFVAAKPCQRVPPANLGLQQCTKLTQQGITCLVTAGIIDDLELVEVEIAQRIRGFASLRTLQCTLKTTFEFCPIDKAGQDVVAGVVAQSPVQLT